MTQVLNNKETPQTVSCSDSFKEQIPKEVQERYRIMFGTEHISIGEPTYISIPLEDIKIENHDISIYIKTPSVWITLWKNITYIHITIFPKGLSK